MGVPANPLSPELALICPELRAHALVLLPAIDPNALFAVAPRPRVKVVPLPVAFAAYAAEAVLRMALHGVVMTTVVAVASFLVAW